MSVSFAANSAMQCASTRSTHNNAILRSAFKILLTACLGVFLGFLAGCGSGGYAGGGIEGLSASTITLDAGQSFLIKSATTGGSTVTWSLSGPACSAAGCGAVSAATGAQVTYTAPTGITAPISVVLTAAVAGTKSSAPVTITVNPDPAILGNPPAGSVGVAYSATLTASGGTGPLTLSIGPGSLPAGLSFNAATGVISGTPTADGASTFTVQVTDASSVPYTATVQKTITIGAGGSQTLTVVNGNPPVGTVGTAYTTSLSAMGGTLPYTWSVASGTLPAGLTLSPTGVISGTPTAKGVSTFTAQAKDATGATATGVVAITINPASTSTLQIPVTTLPGGTVNVPYSAPITVTGGTGPYTCTLTSGTLPAGLTLSPTCQVTGTPTTAGTSTFTVTATDSSNPAQSVSTTITLTIAPATLTVPNSTLPNGTVSSPYSAPVTPTGGTAPYTCSVASGTLPAGLTLGSNCRVTGTPTTAGTSTVTVKATDSGNPAQSATGAVSITIAPAPLTLSISSLPNGTVNTPYSSPVTATGGTAPYTCTLASGTLPAGLTLASNCLVSGIPTTAGASNFTVKVTDAANPALVATGPIALSISPAPLSISLSTLPNGTVNIPYSSNVAVTGGTAPYTCSLQTGSTLPAGLTLSSSCLVSGTPTTAGTVSFTVKANDGSNPVLSVTGALSITIAPAALSINLSSLPNGTLGVPYNSPIGITGGTAPYTCAVTSGALPPGLSLNTTTCVVSGTPVAPAGTANFTVKATDSTSASASGAFAVIISAPATPLALTNPPSGIVGTPYTGVVGVSGGTAPYTCNITAGLPAGLTAMGCAISGTPTAPANATLTVSASDSTTPTAETITSTTVPLTIGVATLTLTGTLPPAVQNAAYSQTLTATGGVAPYTYDLATGSTLPAGLTLSSDGTISGTPTTIGVTQFTVTATDTETTPQTASLKLNLQVVYPSTPNDSILKGQYAYLFQGYDDAVLGVLAYRTATIGSFTADGTGIISAGELDSNHQSTAATGNTIGSSSFVGTYTIAADDTGTFAITAFNPDGTPGATRTYAISLKAPVAPATVTAEGSLIEADDDQVAGTKGAGTLLLQTPTAFTAGLKGNYAFGLEGAIPCIPSCTLGVLAAPVASVGVLTANGVGAVTGTGDAIIETTNYTSAALTGTAAATDANGRIQLSMSTAGTTANFYPTDYAVYVVNANNAFIMSTDKYSNYILLAGTAALQTQATFSNTSMSGPFVGYENAPSNPGLLGTTLQNVLNLTTASVFQGDGTSDGNCAINSVDSGGTAQLVNGLTGLGSGVPILNALLGTYQSTGAVTCGVAASGRGVLTYPVPSGLLSGILALLGLGGTPPPARTFYLISPNNGYFVETGYAGLGHLEAQTKPAGGFTLANTFTGSYVYGTTPASSVASLDGVGSFASNGAGQVTYTESLNVGVGTINILDLSATNSGTYAAPNAFGRFTVNSSATVVDGNTVIGSNLVLYAITPNRFAMVDTSALTTSPSVSLLY
ncbi:Ig domain-containing protein [Granulicella sp. WH15]|uniref:beta strand repeat-containing protein n=1 Tax=Granulicella sp. WH15 TaxID=2602070 RepID=UPI001367982C|nr:putative Ig domain-containing protein [Granulicella sp. WH15]QHN05215.1 Ig domain-containing protein [Granulicella sp. WH15]